MHIHHVVTRTAGIALAALVFVAAPRAQDETFGTEDPFPARAPKAPLTTYSSRFGLELPDDLPAYVLPPIDEAGVFREDAITAGNGDKRVRYAIGRDLFVGPADGVWHALGRGRWLWTVDIVSRGAVGLRLHLAELDLPPGAELMVYSPRDAVNFSGPFAGRGLADDGQLWTPTRAGDRVRVEYLVLDPSGATPPSSPPFLIDRLQHVYRDPEKIAQFLGAGACHNDVTCYSAYSNLKRACAGIGTTGTNSLFCSGTMLDTLASDLTPYFLTANHCLSTASEAANSEVFWNYHTATCNGAPPSLASVPSSAGCSLVSTGTTSDYTLLLINGALPGGLYWAGWTSAAPIAGEPGACIHHPAGDFKRISFGTYSPSQYCTATGHFVVNWTNGPTEPGSSGSGFFKTSTQQLVGQLHCGPSACGNETFDGYGRFADTYPSIASWMDEGNDDAYEENDTCGGHPDLAEGSYAGLVVKSTDPDWYEISVPNGARLSVSLSFTHANGDVDTQLWVNCGDASYTDISAGVSNSELVTWLNDTGSANTVAWKVYLYSDTRATYSMVVSLDPPNDTCATAIDLDDDVTLEGTTYHATNSVAGSCGLTSTAPDVWYSYAASATGILQISTLGSSIDTVVSLYGACGGAEQACNDDAGGGAPLGYGTLQSYLSYPVVAGNDYFIRVAGYNGLQGAFRIRVDTDTGAPYCLGDGISANNCPCGNVSLTVLEGGCQSSIGASGVLAASGVSDVSTDTVLLSGSGMPSNSTCLYFQGTSKQASGLGVAFGDGIRCAAGTVIRLGTKTNSALGTSAYPVGADLDVSVRGLVPGTGGTRYYQIWYRNAASFCTVSTFNLSNGYELSWRP